MIKSFIAASLAIFLLGGCAHDDCGTEGPRSGATVFVCQELGPKVEIDDLALPLESTAPPAPPWEDLDWQEEGEVILASLKGDDAVSRAARGAFVGGMLLRRTQGLGELTVQARDDQAKGRLLEIRGDEVPRAAATKLLQGLKESRDVLGFEFRFVAQDDKEIMAGPMSVSVLSGQLASISILNQVAYVKDFDVKIGGLASIADPIIDVVSEGVVASLRSFADPDGRVELDLEVSASALARPIREFATKLANGQPLTLQLPQVETRRKENKVIIPVAMEQFTIPDIEMPRSDGDGGFLIELVRLEGRLIR